jgi:hypothetical protein
MAASRLKSASMRVKPGVFIKGDGVDGDASSSKKSISGEVTCRIDTPSLG